MAAAAPASPSYCRPLHPSEAVWLATNASSSPLILLATIVGQASVVSAETIQPALVWPRMRHPYLRSCVNTDTKTICPTHLTEIPFSAESLDAESATDELTAVRTIVRQQLSKGVPITETLVRVHLVTSAKAADGMDQRHHLLLIADHIAFDARSFYAILHDIMSASFGGPETKDPLLPFVDWRSRVPGDLKLDALPEVPKDMLQITPSGAPEGESGAGMVTDTVWNVPAALFAAFKAEAKDRGMTLNGPLMMAFATAVAVQYPPGDTTDDDAPAASGTGTSTAIPVRAAVAVDFRRLLDPPLPADYVTSASGLVHFGFDMEVDATKDAFWASCVTLRKDLVERIDAGEALRMEQLLQSGDLASLAGVLNVAFIWSNIGHFGSDTGVRGGIRVDGLESHVMGAAASPMVSVHCTEASGNLAVTLTFGEVWHKPSKMGAVLASMEDVMRRMVA